jgi:hypothetical protein
MRFPPADIAFSNWFAALARATLVEPAPPIMPPDIAPFRFKLFIPPSKGGPELTSIYTEAFFIRLPYKYKGSHELTDA